MHGINFPYKMKEPYGSSMKKDFKASMALEI